MVLYNTNIKQNVIIIYIFFLDHGSRKKKKRSDSETCASAIEKIATALCENNDVPIALPPPPIPDKVDSFLTMLGCQLRELTLRKRRAIMKKISDITYNALEEQYD